MIKRRTFIAGLLAAIPASKARAGFQFGVHGTPSGGGGGAYVSTWNPADNNGTLSNGNKTLTVASNNYGNARAVAALSAGQEFSVQLTGGVNVAYVGLANLTGALPGTGGSFGATVNSIVYACFSGHIYSNNADLGAFGGAAAVNDIIAISIVAGSFTVKKNGTVVGSVTMPVTGAVYPAGSFGNGNFGTLNS